MCCYQKFILFAWLNRHCQVLGLCELFFLFFCTHIVKLFENCLLLWPCYRVTRCNITDNYHNYKINREYFHEKVIIMIRRLEQFIKNQGLSVRSFEQSIGASDGMIRRAIKNNTDIQSKWLSITADIYPNLDINWLLMRMYFFSGFVPYLSGSISNVYFNSLILFSFLF